MKRKSDIDIEKERIKKYRELLKERKLTKEVAEVEDDDGKEILKDRKFLSLKKRLVVQNTTPVVKGTSLKECVKLVSLRSSCCNFRVQLCGKPGLGSTRWFACIRCGKPCDTK